MRAVAVLASFLPLLAAAQSKPRRVLLLGSVRTVPAGTRFALGTRTGVVSVETRGATLTRGGRTATFADLRLGSSVTVFGTLTTPANGARATIVATRVLIAPTPVAGTIRRPAALKRP